MIHRFGALVVGLILILNLGSMRTTTDQEPGSLAVLRSAEVTTGLWMLNVIVGGSYIVFAKVGDFPEWLSLLHLIVGVSAFLSAVYMMLSVRFASASLPPTKSTHREVESE